MQYKVHSARFVSCSSVEKAVPAGQVHQAQNATRKQPLLTVTKPSTSLRRPSAVIPLRLSGGSKVNLLVNCQLTIVIHWYHGVLTSSLHRVSPGLLISWSSPGTHLKLCRLVPCSIAIDGWPDIYLPLSYIYIYPLCCKKPSSEKSYFEARLSCCYFFLSFNGQSRFKCWCKIL